MICTCGYEVHDPPYESWEECGNCDQKLHNLDWRKKQNKIVQTAKDLLHAYDNTPAYVPEGFDLLREAIDE